MSQITIGPPVGVASTVSAPGTGHIVFLSSAAGAASAASFTLSFAVTLFLVVLEWR